MSKTSDRKAPDRDLVIRLEDVERIIRAHLHEGYALQRIRADLDTYAYERAVEDLNQDARDRR